jgi:uncharacterized membrane-anchored protein
MTGRVRSRRVTAALVAVAGLFVAVAALAQEPQVEPEAQPQVRLEWMRGSGAAAPIGTLAEMDLGEDFVYLDVEGTQQLMELTENPLSGKEQATVAPASEGESWFLVFEFDDVGYVSDDEKDSLDADAMLSSIKEGTEAANEERRSRGWGTLQIVGWQEPPHYDERTHNLSWAVIAESNGGRSVNRIVKLLGRHGVMTATLVADAESLAAAVPRVDALLDNYRFKPGSTYAEFVPGKDKLAQYGLTALVVGGAGAALVKSGLLAKLWKPIAVALVALGAGIKRVIFGGRKVEQSLEGKIG